jgi:uncharacterized protein (TIGR00255 family)
MKSMTGFGRGAYSGDGFSVFADLKTVNNRFLDIHLRTSTEISAIEMEIKKQISNRLSRGRVDVTVNFERTGEVVYEINRPLVSGFVSAMKELQKEHGLGGEPDVNVIARLPGALQPQKDSLTPEMIAAVSGVIEEALSELDTMRAKEGDALRAEMLGRIQSIEAVIPRIEAATGGLVDAYRARVHKKIRELLARDGQDIELDAGRLAQEVAYLADRSDISEELTRLKSHVQQFAESLDAESEVGKRLDFLLQELNREANTLLSKSTESSIKEAGLLIKADVEKLREQVQNVE